jgi:hypothetical protein
MSNCKDCTTNCVYRGKDNEARCGSFVGTVTNADRIRAMSDEELATLLSELCLNGENCYSCPLFGKSCGGINGLSGWLDWAKQPAEEEHENG